MRRLAKITYSAAWWWKLEWAEMILGIEMGTVGGREEWI